MRALKIILCIVTALSILAFGLAIYYTQFLRDTISPIFEFDSNVIRVSVKDGDEALLQGITVTDNRDGDLSDQVIVDSVSQLTGVNTARVRYFVFDRAENMATASRTVVYTDYASPRIHIVQPLVYDVGSTIALRGKVIARDTVEGNITASIRLASDDLSNKNAGTYHLTIWAMNRLGDVSSVSVPVVVREPDPNAPVITLTRYLDYLEQGAEFKPESYLRAFYTSPSVPVSGSFDRLKVTGEVDTSTPGSYDVSYSYTNAEGSFTEVYLTVVVENTEIPENTNDEAVLVVQDQEPVPEEPEFQEGDETP